MMATDNITLIVVYNLSTSALFVYNLSTSSFLVYNLSTSPLFDADMNDTGNATVMKTLTSLPISTKQYAINISYILVALLGVVGNLISLVIICKHPPIRKKLLNYYFVNQTVADLLVSILPVPSVTAGLIHYGYSTPLLCLIWQSRDIFFGLYDVWVYSIVAMSVERYLEVVYAIWHK